MLDGKSAIRRFKEFGGWRLIAAYYRMGVLWPGIKSVSRCIKEHSSLKVAYSEIIRNVEGILIKQYGRILTEALKNHTVKDNHYLIPKIAWTCWLQGMEHAPNMVKACVASQEKQLPDYEHRVLTLANYRQWVSLPDYVEEKYKKGRIPRALFSDLLRLAALKKYGGVWMDATVLCTGFGNEKLQGRWHKIEHSEFTIFRYIERGTGRIVGLSNWFIATPPEEIIVSAVLDMLLAYWKNYSCTVDYYMMHLFIGYALRNFPSVAERMPRENSYHSLMLGNALGRDFNKEWWDDVMAHVFMHKLNYRKVNIAGENPNSFYCKLFTQDYH